VTSPSHAFVERLLVDEPPVVVVGAVADENLPWISFQVSLWRVTTRRLPLFEHRFLALSMR
jgi:hypothetical protein